MTIEVRVKPNSKRSEISYLESSYTANLRSKPHEGKANTELISLLAKYFDVSRSCIRIVKGMKGRIKVVQIDNE